ncbi:eukaryotic peptide chain release factor subunit 1-3-like protein [Tanacetum coccineum]
MLKLDDDGMKTDKVLKKTAHIGHGVRVVQEMNEAESKDGYFEEISQDTGKYVFGVDDTLKALEMGVVDILIVWENLDINRDSITNDELKVLEKMSSLEWFANKYRQFGCTLEFVSNKSQEGSQFCRGFSGIGGILMELRKKACTGLGFSDVLMLFLCCSQFVEVVLRSSDMTIPENDRFIERMGQTNDTNTVKTKLASESVVSNPKINRDSVIIEDWTSDDEEEVSGVQKVRPENQIVKTRDDKSGQNSHKQGVGFRKVKAYFVCRSTEHLIKDCNFHNKKSQESNLKNMVITGKKESKPVWDNTKRVNHTNTFQNTHILSETISDRVYQQEQANPEILVTMIQHRVIVDALEP